MKSIFILLLACFVLTAKTQTPGNPTNPFPKNKPTQVPAPTTKPSTPAPIPAPGTPTPPTAPVPSTQVPTQSTPAPAQVPSPPSPVVKPGLPPITGTDQEQIMATVLRVFEAMKMADSSLSRTLFHTNCRLYSVGANATGQNVLTEETLLSFLKAVGTPRKELIDERILNYKINIDGTLAQVWADYNLYVDAKLYHCGVDVFQLFKSPSGWKIFELADTRRKTGCGADPKEDVAYVLDKWHADAAAGRADAYFGAITADGVFLGTDPTERWVREDFRAWAKPMFDAKKTWNFKATKRNVSFANDNTLAWFDEDLTTWMGPSRGSGVLIKTAEGWKIKQYNLTILVPNEKVQDYLKLIGLK